MKSYNVTCPICKTVNHDLLLEETDGWMECEKCKTVTMHMAFYFGNTTLVPVNTPAKLPRHNRRAVN